MLTAVCGGEIRWARDVEKTQGPFVCPSCLESLILKKGRLVVHHFAHVPPVNCEMACGETEAHHEAKLAVYDALKRRPDVDRVGVEHRMEDGSVADVFAVIRGVPVAVEVQRSKLTSETMIYRTSRYHAMGVAVLWVLLGLPPIASRYSPSTHEKWCHAAYYGRVYYWRREDELWAVHFNPFMLQVPVSEFYDKHGNYEVHGGYDKFSKRYRTPLYGPIVRIGENFVPRSRDSWRGGDLYVPPSHLYLDEAPVWWK